MKIERKVPIPILFLFISISFISSSVLFLSFFETSFAQKDVNENSISIIKKYSDNYWKGIKDKIISITNSENTKPLNKQVNDREYIDFNHFHLLHIIPDAKVNTYQQSLIGDTIIPITLYSNMTSLEKARVFQNMSSLGQDRVYQNMTSLEKARVFQNMSSLGQDRVYQNMTSLEKARVYQNMSSLGQDRVYQNMTSLEKARVYQNMSSLAP
jgi:Mg/Co/Ni transporter MgtE